jgi:uncharacterized iron-regulated membrane protein
MTVRKAIFWTHLTTGVIAALVVAMMSITGVLLTYDRQIKDWADRNFYEIDGATESRLTVDELISVAQAQNADLEINTITIINRDDAPPFVSKGRADKTYIDPVSGEILGPGNTSLRGVFSVITRWHRWFDMDGDSRSIGKGLTGVANLMFLFLILSGLYLWLPPLYRWIVVKPRLLFNDKATTAKARDYNWHHVFGFWSLIPLFFIVVSGATLSYRWASGAVYALAGEERPARGRAAPTEELAAGGIALSLQDHFKFAKSQSDAWQRIVLSLPDSNAATISVVVDEGSGGEPTKKKTLIVDRVTGGVVRTETFADRTPAGKVLGYFRWLHTGEALGLTGQTIAGVVTALSVLMVWTGLALAYRRLIQPSIRRRKLRSGN